MMDIFVAAQSEYSQESLSAWQQTYGEPSRKEWNFDTLTEWIETKDDESMRNRLYDTLDFFELN